MCHSVRPVCPGSTGLYWESQPPAWSFSLRSFQRCFITYKENSREQTSLSSRVSRGYLCSDDLLAPGRDRFHVHAIHLRFPGAHRTRNRIPHGRRAQSLGALERSVSRLPQAPASPARPARSPASFPVGSFGDCGRWPFELPLCNVRFARASFHRACCAHRLLFGLEISSWRAQRRTRRRVAQYYPNSAHALHFENMKALADVSAMSPAPTSTEFIQRGKACKGRFDTKLRQALLFGFLQAFAHAKDVAIRMAEMHLTHAPRFVSRRHGDV